MKLVDKFPVKLKLVTTNQAGLLIGKTIGIIVPSMLATW